MERIEYIYKIKNKLKSYKTKMKSKSGKANFFRRLVKIHTIIN